MQLLSLQSQKSLTSDNLCSPHNKPHSNYWKHINSPASVLASLKPWTIQWRTKELAMNLSTLISLTVLQIDKDSDKGWASECWWLVPEVPLLFIINLSPIISTGQWNLQTAGVFTWPLMTPDWPLSTHWPAL